MKMSDKISAAEIQFADLKNYPHILAFAGEEAFDPQRTNHCDFALFEKLIRAMVERLTSTEVLDSEVAFLVRANDGKYSEILTRWLAKNDYHFVVMNANWSDVSSPDAVVKTRENGEKYNTNAGYERDLKIAQSATGGIIIWGLYNRATRPLRDALIKQDVRICTVMVDEVMQGANEK